MELYASTMEELVKYYWRKQHPQENISLNLASTIASIIDALMALLEREGAHIDRMTVKDVAAKAGYSRTTFYVHFCDVYDVLRALEEMLLHHMEMNSKIYYLLFLNTLPDNDVRAVYDMLHHYGKYVRFLLKDPNFSQRYKQKFISVITQDSENSGDLRKVYNSRICASVMIDSYMFWLEHKGELPYTVIVETCNRIAEATIYNDQTLW